MGYEFGLSRRIYGVVPAVVTDNKHPDGLYRVKVKFPWIRDKDDIGDKADFLSSWCRIVANMGGGGRGFYCLPEVKDEVLVTFIHGDMRQPVIIGSMWNGKDKAPVGGDGPPASTDPMGNDLGVGDSCVSNTDAGGKNNARFFLSRQHSVLLFDDTDGKEKVIIKTKKNHTLVLNQEKSCISLYCEKGEEYFHLDQENKTITLETKNGDINVFCKNGTFTLEAKDIVTKASNDSTNKVGNNFKLDVSSEHTQKSGGNTNINGAKINLNC